MKRPAILREDEAGATAVEYALMATLIAVTISTIVLVFGQEVAAMFQPVVDGLP